MRAIKVLFTFGVLLFGLTSVAAAQYGCSPGPAGLMSANTSGVTLVKLYIKAPSDRSAEYTESKERFITFWISGHVPMNKDRNGFVKGVSLCTFGNTKKTYVGANYRTVPSQTTVEMLVGESELLVPNRFLAQRPEARFTLQSGTEFKGTWGSEPFGKTTRPTLTLEIDE